MAAPSVEPDENPAFCAPTLLWPPNPAFAESPPSGGILLNAVRQGSKVSPEARSLPSQSSDTESSSISATSGDASSFRAAAPEIDSSGVAGQKALRELSDDGTAAASSATSRTSITVEGKKPNWADSELTRSGSLKFAPLPTTGRPRRASFTLGVAARAQLLSAQQSGAASTGPPQWYETNEVPPDVYTIKDLSNAAANAWKKLRRRSSASTSSSGADGKNAVALETEPDRRRAASPPPQPLASDASDEDSSTSESEDSKSSAENLPARHPVGSPAPQGDAAEHSSRPLLPHKGDPSSGNATPRARSRHGSFSEGFHHQPRQEVLGFELRESIDAARRHIQTERDKWAQERDKETATPPLQHSDRLGRTRFGGAAGASESDHSHLAQREGASIEKVVKHDGTTNVEAVS